MSLESRTKPLIIPLFIPHSGCPHRCVFCDQNTITGEVGSIPDPEMMKAQIDRYLSFRKPGHNPVQISFYGGTFLGLAPQDIDSMLTLARSYVDRGEVDSIRFSTRPDTVTGETLDRIAGFPVATIELGVQSMDDGVLAASNRGHRASHTIRAVALLRERGYETGVQMMTGLPGSTPEIDRGTAETLAELRPDFARIYPTVVIDGSPLARMYREGVYVPPDLTATVSLVKLLYLTFTKKGVRVIRMGLQATEELDSGCSVLAGPYHPSFGHMVFSEIFLDLARILLKHRLIREGTVKSVVFFVHPKNISTIRGLKSRNIDVLKSKFLLDTLQIETDDTLARDAVATGDGIVVDVRSLFSESFKQDR